MSELINIKVVDVEKQGNMEDKLWDEFYTWDKEMLIGFILEKLSYQEKEKIYAGILEDEKEIKKIEAEANRND